jgi:hypothetical protein
MRQKIVQNRFDKRTKTNGTDKYSAVFTEYSVAEYSAGHYSAEYSTDRIVGCVTICNGVNCKIVRLIVIAQ